ncbi:hypothetical protein EGJ48_22730 [Pantoea dispersa]|uniref:hypothetical protein n=1 Tax=Pantoea dispersa TaxID=59814 RepID=UPI000F66BE4D|nr:hypothetical protein [Pantoea dispersa]RRW60323.1 hypothetical protein EGJ48_22730 [Pantoea dispersa]
MSFGSFLSKAAKFAGKAIVAVASEVINKGPLQINKQYLDKISRFNLDGFQRSEVDRAKRCNEKALSMKRDQSEISGKINELKSEIEELKAKEKVLLIELVQIAKKLPINYESQDKTGIDLILSISKDQIEVGDKEISDEFFEKRDLYSKVVDENSEPVSKLEDKICEHDISLKEKKSDYEDFFPELRDAMQSVKSFGDEILREHNERMSKK